MMFKLLEFNELTKLRLADKNLYDLTENLYRKHMAAYKLQVFVRDIIDQRHYEIDEYIKSAQECAKKNGEYLNTNYDKGECYECKRKSKFFMVLSYTSKYGRYYDDNELLFCSDCMRKIIYTSIIKSGTVPTSNFNFDLIKNNINDEYKKIRFDSWLCEFRFDNYQYYDNYFFAQIVNSVFIYGTLRLNNELKNKFKEILPCVLHGYKLARNKINHYLTIKESDKYGSKVAGELLVSSIDELQTIIKEIDIIENHKVVYDRKIIAIKCNDRYYISMVYYLINDFNEDLDCIDFPQYLQKYKSIILSADNL